MMKKRIPALLGSSVLLTATIFALAACTTSFEERGGYNASAKVHRILSAAGVQNVRVSNVSGRVDVTGTKRSDVEVTATVRARDSAALQKISVVTDRVDDTIHIRTHYPTTFLFFGSRVSGRVDYQILIPENMAVNVSNVDGSVEVTGVTGDVRATSISGDIKATTNRGNLTLTTTSGSIDGSAASLAPGSQLTGGSVSGDIVFRIPKHSGASISARSVSGDFSSNLDVPKTSQTVGTNVSANLNGGGAKISFATVSGSMTLTGF